MIKYNKLDKLEEKALEELVENIFVLSEKLEKEEEERLSDSLTAFLSIRKIAILKRAKTNKKASKK